MRLLANLNHRDNSGLVVLHMAMGYMRPNRSRGDGRPVKDVAEETRGGGGVRSIVELSKWVARPVGQNVKTGLGSGQPMFLIGYIFSGLA